MTASGDADVAAQLARNILGTAAVVVQEIDVGFANQNWRVVSGDSKYVLKVGPVAAATKWAAAAAGRAAATSAGLVVPTLHFDKVVDGRCVRLFDWVDGTSARSLQCRPQAEARLGEQLGHAIAALHDQQWGWFGSRLDGSAGTFASWASYVDHRIDQIRSRAGLNEAPALDLLEQAGTAARSMGLRVSAACSPVVCHRDLHMDNLIVDDIGNLVAIIDWDMPEAWDAAGEWFKLETMLFADLAGARPAFEATYFSVHEREARWEQRVWLVHVIENMNVIANAPNHSADFTQSGIERLEQLL